MSPCESRDRTGPQCPVRACVRTQPAVVRRNSSCKEVTKFFDGYENDLNLQNQAGRGVMDSEETPLTKLETKSVFWGFLFTFPALKNYANYWNKKDY